TGVTATPDPLAGSYFVESMTDEVEERVWEYLEKIDGLGGAVAAIEAGYQMDEIENAAYAYTKAIDSNDKIIVGVNRYNEVEDAEPEIFPIDPAFQKAQADRVRALRASRDQDEVDRHIEALKAAARGTDNVLYPMKDALRAKATLGEVSDALREIFGVYQPAR
ncbi:MAG: methylmalonyl-CoA mutase family protein, partial [Acidimicrobiales bacterium]